MTDETPSEQLDQWFQSEGAHVKSFLDGFHGMKGDPQSEAQRRKSLPITTGVLDYFPDALLAVAEVSRIGNDQHNPGEPLHWARGKSMDQADCLVRHLIDRGKLDSDGARHSAKVAWRALALLQLEIEEDRG